MQCWYYPIVLGFNEEGETVTPGAAILLSNMLTSLSVLKNVLISFIILTPVHTVQEKICSIHYLSFNFGR